MAAIGEARRMLTNPQEDVMPLTQDDIDAVARAVWARRNKDAGTSVGQAGTLT